nr:lipopolysaccharide biosynthesis protein [uncultured Carboxylicivirga sp.]
MINNELKNKASKGVAWNALDKFVVQGGQFVISLILARVIDPEDFGIMAIIAVFIQLSQVVIEGGLGMGLIQKKDRTEADFSTAFITNLVVSVIIYAALFLFAPLIANFYSIPSLSAILRIVSLNLIIGAFTLIQITKLSIEVDFKSIAKVNLTSMLVSGTVAIVSAYWGLGIYALVIQSLVRSLVTLVGLIIIKRKFFYFKFSKESFKDLYGFSFKLLIANLYSQIITNVYNLVIGKFYATSDLGFYSRSRLLTDVSSGTISSVVQQVSFPILSLLQDDREKLNASYRKTIRITAFVIFPSMVMISILSESIIRLLFNDKWLMVIPLLQWMAFTRLLYPLSAINLNILNVKGRSDLYLKLELIKFPIIVIPMLVTMFISLKALVIGQVVASFISFFVNAYYPGKMYGYGGLKQLIDLKDIIIATVLMALTLIGICILLESMLLKLVVGVIVGGVCYLAITKLLRCKEYNTLIELVKSNLSKLN